MNCQVRGGKTNRPPQFLPLDDGPENRIAPAQKRMRDIKISGPNCLTDARTAHPHPACINGPDTGYLKSIIFSEFAKQLDIAGSSLTKLPLLADTDSGHSIW